MTPLRLAGFDGCGGHISGPASKDPFCHRTLHGDVDSIRARGGCPIGLPRDARHHSHRCGEPLACWDEGHAAPVGRCMSMCPSAQRRCRMHALALAILASNGAIARRGDIIERAGSIDLALLDKTGTLTAGKPRLTEIITPPRQSEDVALRLAAGLEQSSNHPYAVAILERLESSSLSPTRISRASRTSMGASSAPQAGDRWASYVRMRP